MKIRLIMSVISIMAVLLSGCKSAEPVDSELEDSIVDEQNPYLEEQSLTIELSSFYHFKSNPDDYHVLGRKIEQFRKEHPDAKITIKWVDTPRNESDASRYEREENLPDIIEASSNELLRLYKQGKIEPLNLNESSLREIVLTSPDGQDIGIKSKINPFIIFYNKDTFQKYGMDEPTSLWDVQKLKDTIVQLKAAGQNVFVPLTPYTLEWATSLHGGHIVAPDGVTFTDYLDSDKAVEAAEWIVGVESKLKEGWSTPAYPIGIWDGSSALAVDVAYDLFNYEYIAQKNDKIGIAVLPCGSGGGCPANTTGLAVTSGSKQKPLAYELIKYLTRDNDLLYTDIAVHTMQALTNEIEKPADPDRLNVIIQAMKQSVPATLYRFDTFARGGWGYSDNLYPQKPFDEILKGQLVPFTLSKYASELDVEFGGNGDE